MHICTYRRFCDTTIQETFASLSKDEREGVFTQTKIRENWINSTLKNPDKLHQKIVS